MQIACNRFSCQKAVEVCYWTCKFRRDCKDWHNALAAQPGIEAITERLKEAAKKNGRAFDPQTMVLTSRGKNKRAAIVSRSSIARLEAASVTTDGRETDPSGQAEQVSNSITKTKNEEDKEKMTEANLDIQFAEPAASAWTDAETATSKPAASKTKPKPAAKPKPFSPDNGPVFLLLYPNGKYKELREAELNTEAADMLKDPALRLVKGQPLVPQISFHSAVE